MIKKIVISVILALVFVSSLPVDAFAQDYSEDLVELKNSEYILNLVGDSYNLGYHSGLLLSENMNAAQIEECLNEFIEEEVESTLFNLEDVVTFGRRNVINNLLSGSNDENYDEVIDMFDEVSQIKNKVKNCHDIIQEERYYILSALEDLDNENNNEHENASLAHHILENVDDLKKQISFACDNFAEWKKIIKDTKDILIETSSDEPSLSFDSNPLKSKLVKLKSGRLSEMKNIASLEQNVSNMDVVIDVVSIHEIRLYALDEENQPLKDALIYCWRADDENPERRKGEARLPNEEGYVTVPIIELGADEDHYMKVGYEIICPGYRSIYSEANYIKGGEIFYSHLEKNNPLEDVYVAGISLNGYDCKWYEKELYITDENTADQRIELFLRSQSGDDFSGVASMSYVKRFQNNEYDDLATIDAEYISKNGQASAIFSSKLCQNVAGDQEKPLSFSLSTSVSNDEICPSLKSVNSRIDKTKYANDRSIIDALYFGQLSFSLPGNVPFLDSMSLNFDVGQLLDGHVFVLTNCSGLWAIFASTNELPSPKKIQELNYGWMTADSKEIEAMTNSEINHYAASTKQQIAANYKTEKYNNGVAGYYGGKKLYGNLSAAAFGTYENASEKGITFTGLIGAQFGFRGDWTKQLFVGWFPVKVGWGFDLSFSAFFKFDFSGLEYNGVDISVSPRFLGYMSGGPGFRIKLFGKTFSAGLGFRFQLVLTLNLPLLQKSMKEAEPKTFVFDICLSFYADFFFIHFLWNMWSGVGELNINTGDFDFKSKPFWKGSNTIASINSASSLGIEKEKDKLGTTIDEKIETADDINGDTLWSYSEYQMAKGSDSIPTHFTLHWESTFESHSEDDCDYLFWIENGKSVKYTITNYFDPYPATFEFPSEVQRKLDSGEWKVTGVNAVADPNVYELSVRAYNNYIQKIVQLATVSVTIGTDYSLEEEIQGDKVITKEIPHGSVIVTRAFMYDGTMDKLQYVDDNNQLHDVVYVNKSSVPMSEAIGMFYNIQLIAKSVISPLFEEIYMKQPSSTSLVVFGSLDDPKYINVNDVEENIDEFGASDVINNPGLVYFSASKPGEGIVDSKCRSGSLPQGKVLKQLFGGSGKYAFMVALMEDGSLWFVTPDHAKAYKIEYKDYINNIADFAMIRTNFVANKSSDYTVFFTKKAGDSNDAVSNMPLESIVITSEGRYFGPGEYTNYDVDLKGAAIFAGKLLSEDYLYWFETYKDEETGRNLTAVRGMCYSPKYNMMTSSYRLGILDGSDGEVPDGYVTTSIPLNSHVMSNGDMLITKAWLKDEEKANEDDKQILSTYKVSVVRRVSNVILGAGSEMPAVSAGRDCNFLFTVINKGNIPIVGFDFSIYHENEKGVKELVQTSHVDLTNSDNNTVEYIKSGYTDAKPMLYEGEYAIRRVGGLYDMINGDEWYIKRENSNYLGDGSVFVNIPALMPHGVQTYSLVFSVPEDWEHKTTISCQIDSTYVPKYTADIFALSKVVEETSNLASMPVLAISKVDNTENKLLKKGEGYNAAIQVAGSLNSYEKQNGILLESETIKDECGQEMLYEYTPGLKDVDFDVVNLAIKCRVFEKDGEKYATIYISQDGQTDNVAPMGVNLNAYLDDDVFPSFTYTFKTHPIDGQLTYSMTLPIKTLTNNQYGDLLTLTVSDSVVDNEEMSENDNKCTIELNQSLKIISEPKDISLYEGQSHTFKVRVKGGKEIYHYHWQQLINGVWVDLETKDSPYFSLTCLSNSMNGMVYRCVIEDSANNHVTTNPFKLTINRNKTYVVPNTVVDLINH